MFKLLLLLTLATSVYAAGNSCKTGNIVNRLMNNQSYYWPSTWNENETAPKLEKDQTCSWIVTIPEGYYARLIIDGKMEGKDSRIQMIDSVGNFEQTTHEKKDPYFFLPAKFTLAVSNLAAATFAFKIQWFPFPRGPYWASQISSGMVINATNLIDNMIYGYTNGLSVLVFPEDRKNYHSLRSTLVFESDGSKLGNFVSSLYTLYKNNRDQYFTRTADLAFMNVEVSGNIDLVVMQNADLVRNLTYVELVTVANSTYTATLNSENKSSALITATTFNQTMIDVQMNDDDYLTVYEGAPSIFSFPRNYTGAQLKAALPIFYYENGKSIYQWMLHSGTAVFTFQA